jgi:hypothetical protein
MNGNAIAREHFDRCRFGGPRKGVRVFGNEHGTVDASIGAVLDDRLSDREDVRFIERSVERASSVAARTKGDALRSDGWIWMFVVVGAQKRINIDQLVRIRRTSRRALWVQGRTGPVRVSGVRWVVPD